MQSGFKQKQRGATFLGMVTIIAILGLALYAGIRLVPLYLDNMAVQRAMTQVSQSLTPGEMTSAGIRSALAKRWTVDYISSVEPSDIEVTKAANGIEMRAAYEARAPFIANISLVVAFDSAVIVNSGGGGP